MHNMASPHATLRILLAVIATLGGVGGVLLFFAPSWGTQIIAAWFGGTMGGLERVLMMAVGAMVLALCYMLFAAARDPERNVAIIDATAGLMVLVALLGAYSVVVLHLGGAQMAPLIWVGTAIRLALAAWLIALRPRLVRPTIRSATPRSSRTG
jgi:hypothetical protein